MVEVSKTNKKYVFEIIHIYCLDPLNCKFQGQVFDDFF